MRLFEIYHAPLLDPKIILVLYFSRFAKGAEGDCTERGHTSVSHGYGGVLNVPYYANKVTH